MGRGSGCERDRQRDAVCGRLEPVRDGVDGVSTSTGGQEGAARSAPSSVSVSGVVLSRIKARSSVIRPRPLAAGLPHNVDPEVLAP